MDDFSISLRWNEFTWLDHWSICGLVIDLSVTVEHSISAIVNDRDQCVLSAALWLEVRHFGVFCERGFHFWIECGMWVGLSALLYNCLGFDPTIRPSIIDIDQRKVWMSASIQPLKSVTLNALQEGDINISVLNWPLDNKIWTSWKPHNNVNKDDD